MASRICSPGFNVLHDVFSPEERLRKQMGGIYAAHPVMSRIVAVPIQTVIGIAKTVLFPLWSAVATLVLPIVMAVRACQGKENTGHIQAWTFCMLGVGLFVGFVSLSTMNFSLLASASIFLGAMSFTIALHVYRGVQAPPSVIDKLA